MPFLKLVNAEYKTTVYDWQHVPFETEADVTPISFLIMQFINNDNY